MIAKTLSGILINIEADTVEQFIQRAREILNVDEEDELKMVFDNETNQNILIVIPFDHQRELFRLIWKSYREYVYINSIDAHGCVSIFCEAFEYYQKHFNPPEVVLPDGLYDAYEFKMSFFNKAYEFEKLMMDLHPYTYHSQEQRPTEEQVMQAFWEMYEAYQKYDQIDE